MINYHDYFVELFIYLSLFRLKQQEIDKHKNYCRNSKAKIALTDDLYKSATYGENGEIQIRDRIQLSLVS